MKKILIIAIALLFLPSISWGACPETCPATPADCYTGTTTKVVCDTTTGEGNAYESGTDDLGVWSGTSGAMNIGDLSADATGYYIDNIKIYDTWQ